MYRGLPTHSSGSMCAAVAAILTVVGLLHLTPAAPIKIMPLGDSRTAGPDSRNCYRLYLDRLLTAAGYEFDFVGSLRTHSSNGREPDSIFDADHEGHWGWPVQNLTWYTYGQMKEGAGKWMRAAEPDIVLALLGFADIINESDSFDLRADRTIEEIGILIDTLRAVDSSIIILLANQYPCSPTWVRPPLPSAIDSFNVRVPGLVQAKHTETSPVIFVDTWTGFDWRRDLIDGTHANQGGSTKIALNWLEALWPFFDSVPPPTVVRSVPKVLRIANNPQPSMLFPGTFFKPEGVWGFTLTGRRALLSGNSPPRARSQIVVITRNPN